MASLFGRRPGRGRSGTRRSGAKGRANRRLGVEPLERRELLAVAVADFNGDGFGDTASGMPDQNTVAVAYGTASGTQRQQSWTQDSRKIKDKLEAGDQFGAALAAGDFNRDGFDDLVIGAPGEDLKEVADVGVVHVLYGSAEGLTRRKNSMWFQDKSGIAGEGETGDMFGASLQVGDFDGDGFDDLSVRVPGDDTLNRLFGSTKGIAERRNELVPASGGGGSGGASLSIRNTSVVEGDSGTTSAVFTVTRSGSLAGTATVNFATAGDTAHEGSDYLARSGQLTFQPNVTSQTVGIDVIGDTSVESDERFYLNLSGAVGGSIQDSQGRATIVDDDDQPPPPPPPPPPGDGMTFAVIGDFGSDGADEAHVANMVKSWNPDFVITVGDNNYSAGSVSTIDVNIGKYYQEFIGDYQGTFGPGSAENRFFPSLGNHDWGTDGARPYLDYFNLPGNERYYDYVQGPVHFFAIDSDGHEPDGNSAASRQAQWLKAALAASTSPFQVVYFHHSPYSSGSHGSEGVMQWPFKQWGADVVLSGHDHNYERLNVDGLPYYVDGTGGRSLRSIGTPVAGSQFRYDDDFGAMLVTADADSMTFEFHSVAGGDTLIDRSVVAATSP